MSTNPTRSAPNTQGSAQQELRGEGVSALLLGRLGLQVPRPHFHLGQVVHASQELGLFRLQPTLQLGNDLTGLAWLQDWQWEPQLPETQRPQAWRALLRQAQSCLQGQRQVQPSAWGESLVVELPGWRDAAGQSPFWEALAGRFYPGDPAQAAQTHGPAWLSHLASLLPRQTIYVSMLGEAVAHSLGQVQADLDWLRQGLQDCGFVPAQQLRLHDGGPVWIWHAPAD